MNFRTNLVLGLVCIFCGRTVQVDAQSVNWVRSYSGINTSSKFIGAISAKDDEVYAFGASSGVTKEGLSLPVGLFISKFTADGVPVWNQNIVSLDNSMSTLPSAGLKINSADEVVIAGNIRKRVQFGVGPSQKVLSVDDYQGVSSSIVLPFLARYTASGQFIDGRILASSNYVTYVRDIVLDSKDNIYVAGTYNASLTLDKDRPAPQTITSTSVSAFVAKYNSNLDLIWVVNIQANDFNTLANNISLEISEGKDLVLGGTFYGTLTFTSRNGLTTDLTAHQPGETGETDYGTFLAKMDTTGNFTWARRSIDKPINQGDNGNYLNDLDVDGEGNIYTAGSLGGGAIFGKGTANELTLPFFLGYNSICTKYTKDGDFVWVRRGAASVLDDFDAGRKVDCAADGNCIFGGEFMGKKFNFEGTTETLEAESANSSVFLIHLNAAGSVQTMTQFIHSGTGGTTYLGFQTNLLLSLLTVDLQHVYAGGTYFRTSYIAEGFDNPSTLTIADGLNGLFVTSLSWVDPPDPVTGIEAPSRLTMYPNPASDYVSFDTGDNEGQHTVELQNMMGQRVAASSGSRVITLGIQDFPAGLYLAIISDELGIQTVRKLVIAR